MRVTGGFGDAAMEGDVGIDAVAAGADVVVDLLLGLADRGQLMS